MINYYTLHVSFITTKSKNTIYKMNTKCSRVGWRSRESKGEVWLKGQELVRLLTKKSLILCGWLHFDPSFGTWTYKSKGVKTSQQWTGYNQMAKRQE